MFLTILLVACNSFEKQKEEYDRYTEELTSYTETHLSKMESFEAYFTDFNQTQQLDEESRNNLIHSTENILSDLDDVINNIKGISLPKSDDELSHLVKEYHDKTIKYYELKLQFINHFHEYLISEQQTTLSIALKEYEELVEMEKSLAETRVNINTLLSSKK